MAGQEKTDEDEHISFNELSQPEHEVSATSSIVHLPLAEIKTNTDDDLKASTESKIDSFLSYLTTIVKDAILPQRSEAIISENDNDRTISLAETPKKIDQNENKTPASEMTIDDEISDENEIIIQKEKDHTADPTLDIVHGISFIPNGVQKSSMDKRHEAVNILDQQGEYIPSASISKITSSPVGTIEQPTVIYSAIDRAEQRDTTEPPAVSDSSFKEIPHVTSRQLEFNTVASQKLMQTPPDTLDKFDTASWPISDQVMKLTSAVKHLSEQPLIDTTNQINEQYTSTLPTSTTADKQESQESTKDQSDVFQLSSENMPRPKLTNEMATEGILSSMDYSVQQESIKPLTKAPEVILSPVDQLQGGTIESKPSVEKLFEAYLKEPTTTATTILFETEQQDPRKDETDELEQSIKPSSTVNNVTETTSEDHVLMVEDISRKESAEHLISEVHTEPIHKIVTISATENLPEIDRTPEAIIENEAVVSELSDRPSEKASNEIEGATSAPVSMGETEVKQLEKDESSELEQSFEASPIVENVTEATSEDHVLPGEGILRKESAEPLTSEILTEDTPEIAVPAVTINLSEFKRTSDSTVEDGELAEKGTVDGNGQIKKEIDSTPLTSLTITDEEKRQITKIEPKELQQLITSAVMITETVEKAPLKDQLLVTEEVGENSEGELIAMKSTVEDAPDTSLESAPVNVLDASKKKVEIDSFCEIVNQVIAPTESSIPNEDEEKDEISSTQSWLDGFSEDSTLTKSISSKADQNFLQLTVTNMNQQSYTKTSFAHNTTRVESDIVSNELESSSSQIFPMASTSSPDESFSSDDNQPISSSLNATANTVVTGAIVDACCLLEESILGKNDNKSPLAISSTDESFENADIQMNSTNIIASKLYDDYNSTSELENIVNSILNFPNQIFPESSALHENIQVIVSPKFDFDDQVKAPELTNIIDLNGKTLNIQTDLPEPSKTTGQLSLQRASAVEPNSTNIAVDNDRISDNGPIFFVPEMPTNWEANFIDLYEHRHLISDSAEELPHNLAFIDKPQSLLSIAESDDEKNIFDSPLTYYELQERRHALISQQPTENEEKETNSSTLTRWATTPPLIIYEKEEEQPETKDIDLDDQAYEYARRFDLESPSIISNLPAEEYHQVFGVPNEVLNAVIDVTLHVEQNLSMDLKHDQQLVASDEIENLSPESDRNLHAEENKYSSLFKTLSVSDNVKRITEAIDALESDLLDQEDNTQLQESPATETIVRLVGKQDVITPGLLSTDVDNEIQQTIDERSFTSQFEDASAYKELLTNETELETFHEKDKNLTTSNMEFNSRYSTLLDRLDSLERPLLDLEPFSLVTPEKRAMTTGIEEEYNHVTKLEEVTNQDLIRDTSDANAHDTTLSIDKQMITPKDEGLIECVINTDELAKTMEQTLDTPFRTAVDLDERSTYEGSTDYSNLESVIEQMVTATQFSTKNIKLPKAVDTIPPSDQLNDKQEEMPIQEPPDEITTSIFTDRKHISSQEPVPNIQEKVSPSIFDQATSTMMNEISNVTTTFWKTDVSQETIPSYKSSVKDSEGFQTSILSKDLEMETAETSAITPVEAGNLYLTQQEIFPLRQFNGNKIISDDREQQGSTKDLIENKEIILSTPTRMLKTRDSDSGEKTPIVNENQNTILVSMPQTRLRASSTKDIPATTHSIVELHEKLDTTSPVPGYFSSNDVYHAYKQPIEPITQEKLELSNAIEKTKAIITDTVSNVSSALPTLQTTEATTPTDISINLQEISPHEVAKDETTVLKSSTTKKDIEYEEASSLGISETSKNIPLSTIQSPETEEPKPEEETSIMKEDHETISPIWTKQTVTSAPEEDVSTTTHSIVELHEKLDTTSPVPGYFSSNDVYHAYIQPLKSSIKEEAYMHGDRDLATWIVNNIIPNFDRGSLKAIYDEEVVAPDNRGSSKENVLQLEPMIDVDKTTMSTDLTIWCDAIPASTEQVEETSVSKSPEDPSKNIEGAIRRELPENFLNDERDDFSQKFSLNAITTMSTGRKILTDDDIKINKLSAGNEQVDISDLKVCKLVLF